MRRPSRVERQYETTSVVDPSRPAFVHLSPNPDFQPEKLLAYEVGYRTQPAARTFLSVSAFYNDWKDLLSTELDTPVTEGTPPHLTFPVSFRNGLDGTSRGVEATLDVRPREWWRWVASYAYLNVRMTPKPGLRTSHRRPATKEEAPGTSSGSRPPSTSVAPCLWTGICATSPRWWIRRSLAYATSDVRLAWHLAGDLDLAGGGTKPEPGPSLRVEGRERGGERGHRA